MKRSRLSYPGGWVAVSTLVTPIHLDVRVVLCRGRHHLAGNGLDARAEWQGGVHGVPARPLEGTVARLASAWPNGWWRSRTSGRHRCGRRTPDRFLSRPPSVNTPLDSFGATACKHLSQPFH